MIRSRPCEVFHVPTRTEATVRFPSTGKCTVAPRQRPLWERPSMRLVPRVRAPTTFCDRHTTCQCHPSWPWRTKNLKCHWRCCSRSRWGASPRGVPPSWREWRTECWFRVRRPTEWMCCRFSRRFEHEFRVTRRGTALWKASQILRENKNWFLRRILGSKVIAILTMSGAERKILHV